MITSSLKSGNLSDLGLCQYYIGSHGIVSSCGATVLPCFAVVIFWFLIKLASTWKLHTYWQACIVLDGSMYATRKEQ